MRFPTGLQVIVDPSSRTPWYGEIVGHIDSTTYDVLMGGSYSAKRQVAANRLALRPDLDTFLDKKVKVIEAKGEKNGFVWQDLLGVEQVAQEVIRNYAPAKHVFLCLGNSPYPLCYYLEIFKDCRVIYMPLSNVECLGVETTNDFNKKINQLSEEAAEGKGDRFNLRVKTLFDDLVIEAGGAEKLKEWELSEMRSEADLLAKKEEAAEDEARMEKVFELRRSSFQEIFKVEKYLSNFTEYVSRYVPFDELDDKNLSVVVVDFVTSGNAILGVSEGIKAIFARRSQSRARCKLFGLRAAPTLFKGIDAGVFIQDDSRKLRFTNEFLRKVIKETYKKLELLLCKTGSVNFIDVLESGKYSLTARRSSVVLFKLLMRARHTLLNPPNRTVELARKDVFGS
ncbi:hypothetical protein LZ198_28095 [Myxococcus sp. K15C18031901]|uniref:hypothetical protein n=1 Tax=Myxococcus dinghuensis TaxID=2906761 RepID=UPI0020A6F926|nr:hypothetical protein [Myxococcus dinghuensis]MCP3102744.1 hypothetical protein [Myxococcus dinghuensis]